VDFSPEKGRIVVRIEQESRFIRIFVLDEGPGIAGFAKDRVFEKFFSLQRPDTGQKSTGLGLNFVRQVALLHHGEVRLENRPEGGAEAMLKLAIKIP
jgi:two-component system sensor histidine kinase CreC